MVIKHEIDALRRVWYRRSATFVFVAFVLPGLAVLLQNQLEIGLAPYPVELIWVSICVVAVVRTAIAMQRLRNALLIEDRSPD